MTQDGIELAELLGRKLKRDRIILVGHSWGSILGVFMVKARPDLFYAFVGTGQVADPASNYSVAYQELLRKAERVKERRAIRELQEVGPPPWPDGRGYAPRKAFVAIEGGHFAVFMNSDGFLKELSTRVLPLARQP
jgi:pimeloyl-ACP methyl ester carboxylesterase